MGQALSGQFTSSNLKKGDVLVDQADFQTYVITDISLIHSKALTDPPQLETNISVCAYDIHNNKRIVLQFPEKYKLEKNKANGWIGFDKKFICRHSL